MHDSRLRVPYRDSYSLTRLNSMWRVLCGAPINCWLFPETTYLSVVVDRDHRRWESRPVLREPFGWFLPSLQETRGIGIPSVLELESLLENGSNRVESTFVNTYSDFVAVIFFEPILYLIRDPPTIRSKSIYQTLYLYYKKITLLFKELRITWDIIDFYCPSLPTFRPLNNSNVSSSRSQHFLFCKVSVILVGFNR